MEALHKKIRALHAINEEIIARVEKLHEVLHYDYFAFLDDGLVLEEVSSTVKVGDILKDFKCEVQLVTDIWDVFNDKPNWQAKAWDDLKRLNHELFAIAEKFELLDKSNAKAQTELAKYLHNFELIQTSLGAVEEKTLSQISRQDQLAARVAEVNRLLDGLKLDGVQFRQPSFAGGSIVSPEHGQKLVEWYGKGWRLLYKASRDGWAGKDFHSRCDGKGATVTVVRCTGGHVFGGHLAQSWNSLGNYITCPSASLFTLANPHGIPPTRLAISSAAHAACGVADRGPTFGHDLHIATHANASTASYFNFPHGYRDTTGRGQSLFTGNRAFQVAEVEVFAQQ